MVRERCQHWWHRAYWGANLLQLGNDIYLGPLPTAGQWVRLEIPATAVDLGGRTVTAWLSPSTAGE